MYYSRLAWWIGAFMCVITTISCTVFVIGTAEPFRYSRHTHIYATAHDHFTPSLSRYIRSL